jgi:hypothetical protein
MEFFSGLDVSMERTPICVVDDKGEVQMQTEIRPAATVAPESELKATLETLNVAFRARYNVPLLRDHETVPALLRRTHRFQAAEAGGLLELAKDLTRLLAERIDVEAVLSVAPVPKGEQAEFAEGHRAADRAAPHGSGCEGNDGAAIRHIRSTVGRRTSRFEQRCERPRACKSG